MPHRMIALAAMIAAGLAAVPAAAQATDESVRCMLAANVFSKAEKDPAKRNAATEALFFFMGRLDTKMAPAQIKAVMLAQGKTMNAQNLGPTMNSCIQLIGARQKVMQGIAQELAASQPKAPPPAK